VFDRPPFADEPFTQRASTWPTGHRFNQLT